MEESRGLEKGGRCSTWGHTGELDGPIGGGLGSGQTIREGPLPS